MKTQFDIFISYRREGGLELADSIYQRLINAGYSTFLDLEQLNSGQFNTKLINVIEQCQDFILVLPPHALDRCNEEDDWVRQEIECALANNKNIIPIMLRGFEWPSIETLPMSLRALPNFNGISASDHNVFVENIERLKHNFLHSKPGITWRRYRKIIWSIIVLLILSVGIVLSIFMQNKKQYESLCNELAMDMMTEVVKLNNNILSAEEVLNYWKEFVKYYEKEELSYLQKNLKKSTEHAEKNMQKLKPLNLTDEHIAILRKNNVEIEEIKAFSSMAQSIQDDIHSFCKAIIMFSETSMNDFIIESPNYSYETLVASLKVLYFGTLSIYKTWPITIYEKLHQTTPQLALLSSIPLSLSKEDYDALQEGAMSELNRIVDKMKVRTDELEDKVILMEEKREKMENDLKKMYVEKGFERIDEKRTAVAKRKAEVAEADKKLTDIYLNALKRHELLNSDDQGIMWGKILRIAKLAEIAKESEDKALQQHKELIAMAKEKGISTDNLSEPMFSITAQEKYRFVDKWLVRYQDLNPAKEAHVADYINAARAYFKAVAASEIKPNTGILLVGTKDNAMHPVYQIGDIVIERCGSIIHTTDQYFKMNKDPQVVENNYVKVLRLIDGVLKEKTLSIPANCKVLVGFTDLHEEN